MVRFYILLILCIFFTYTIAKNMDNYYSNRTNVSSKSIYELVQMRIAAARLARRHRNNTQLIKNRNYAMKMKMSSYSKDDHNEILTERLKILVTISSTVLLLMIIIVIMCIVRRYYQDKNFKPTERAVEQNKTTRYSQVKSDKRNFSRKKRKSPTAV